MLDRIAENVTDHPITATTLALLLRVEHQLSVGRGRGGVGRLFGPAAGPQFAAWRGARPPRVDKDAGPRFGVTAEGDLLVDHVGHTRSADALDAAMRDEPVEALTLATTASDIARVEPEDRAGRLRRWGSRRVRKQVGSGDSAPHPPAAQRRACGIFGLNKPTVIYLHGASMGSGIELVVFTDWVVVAADTDIALLEIGLGLVPGVGGMVSRLAGSGVCVRCGSVLGEHHRCRHRKDLGFGRRAPEVRAFNPVRLLRVGR